MKVINIADRRNRNTHVGLETRRPRPRYRFVGPRGAEVRSLRVIKGSWTTDLKHLTREASLKDLSQRLIDGDPEIDIELFGKRIEESSRIYLDANNAPAHNVVIKELVYTARGELTETRDPEPQAANINGELPLKWSGKLLPKSKVARKMAFVHCHQIVHVDGLTYDFLYGMAKELEDQSALLYLAAGPKMNDPLVLTRNGTPYRGFLEGRTREDKYLLLLHLSNLELKPLGEPAP
jgi:hypothetical protein